jgi:hypothetical protein
LIRRRGDRAQATVEFALVLPLLALLLVAVVQAALVVRDQVHLTRATSAAARAVMVEPELGVARRVLEEVGGGLDIREVRLSGGGAPGSLLTVTASARPTAVPLSDPVVGRIRLSERFVVRVEGE